LRQITVNKAQLLQLAVQFQFSVVNGAPRRTGAAKTKRQSWEKAPKRLQTPKSETERERERWRKRKRDSKGQRAQQRERELSLIKRASPRYLDCYLATVTVPHRIICSVLKLNSRCVARVGKRQGRFSTRPLATCHPPPPLAACRLPRPPPAGSSSCFSVVKWKCACAFRGNGIAAGCKKRTG